MTHTNQLAILASLKGIVQPRYGGARNTLCCTARPHPFIILFLWLCYKTLLLTVIMLNDVL